MHVTFNIGAAFDNKDQQGLQ